MRLAIEIAVAALLLFCISASSAAFAAGNTGRSADDLSCAFTVPYVVLAKARTHNHDTRRPVMVTREDVDVVCWAHIHGQVLATNYDRWLWVLAFARTT
jgi:hypothetical protein